MRLLTYIKIKKNYKNFIDLLNLIDKTKFINDEKINIEKFDNVLISINKNKKKNNIYLFIQSIDFLLLLNSLGYLEINLFKFKDLIEYSFTKLQKTINKNTQSDKLKKKINEFNFLVNSVLLFKEEKEYKEYSKIVDQTIKVFNNLLKSNINLSSKKISKKTKLILIITGSILAFLAVSSAVIVPTTIHILNKNKTAEDKIIPWTKLQPSIKVKYNLYKLKNIPWSFHNRINDNITNKTEEKLNVLDKQFAVNSDLNVKWFQISKYYDEFSVENLIESYKSKLNELFNSKKDIETLMLQVNNLNDEYKNNIEKHNEVISLYFSKYIKPTNNLLNKSMNVNEVYEQTFNTGIHNIIKEFNYNFINNFDIYEKTSFEHLKRFYSDLNTFIDRINEYFLDIKDLKLRYIPTKDDFDKILEIFNDFKNNKNNNFDIYITKTIQNYLDYFSKVNFFPLIVERLTYFKNNFDFGEKYQTIQWFITKNKKLTLNPENEDVIEWRLPYKHGINLYDEYIVKLLKNYDDWLWIINDEEKIGEINLENVKAFNYWKYIKNDTIANEFKDYENFNINVSEWKYPVNIYGDYYVENISKEMFNYLSKIYGNNWQTNDNTSKIWFFNNYKVPYNFNYKLYSNYYGENVKSMYTFPIVFEFLTEQPNYFTDLKNIYESTSRIKPEYIHKKTDINNEFEYPDTNNLKKDIFGYVDKSYFYDRTFSIKQYIQWRKNWEEVLSKFISKNWNQKQIILAISFYITSNAMYMYSNDEELTYNTDGNSNQNPASLFETDRSIQCHGYSQNFSMALTLLNIPVRTITGITGSIHKNAHAWNEVFVDGMWKCVDLTNADSSENAIFYNELSTYWIFIDRNNEWHDSFRLYYSDYLTTIIKYLNKDENGNYVHNYVDLPTHYSTNPETELKWENMLPLLRQQYKTNQY